MAVGRLDRTDDEGHVQLAIAEQRDRFGRSALYNHLLDHRIARAKSMTQVSKEAAGDGAVKPGADAPFDTVRDRSSAWSNCSIPADTSATN